MEFSIGNKITAAFPSKPTEYYDWVSAMGSYRKYVTSKSKVLEIGASRPEKTRELSRWCDELIGVEVFPERTPSDFDNVHYITGNWENLSQIIPPESIDLAISTHVIEHVPEDLKAINELYKVLKPGGRAILNTPNRKRLVRSIIEKVFGEKVFPHGEHMREYVESDLVQLLDASSFRNYHVHPLVFGLHGGPFFLYTRAVPDRLRSLGNFWEIHLLKGNRDNLS